MIGEEEIEAEALRWGENLMKHGTAKAAVDPAEEKIIAKLFGSKTAAEHFLRQTSVSSIQSGKPRADLRGNRPYRPPQVRLRFEFWDMLGTEEIDGGWRIDRFENGRKVHTHYGSNYQKRDDLLIRLQAAGAQVAPVTVACVEPRPIRGRLKDKPKPVSAKFAILDRLKNFDPDDFE